MATSLSYVVVVLDTSIVNVALAQISSSLHCDVTGLQWVINAYILAFASLLLTGGVLGDRFGARNVYLIGLLIFASSSALCGAAPDLWTLVTARALQGLGAALLVPCSLTLISGAYPDAGQRSAAIGVWAGYGGIAMAAGPLLGGLLIHAMGWRSIFLVNVPIAMCGAWLASRVPSGRTVAAPKPLDLAGQFFAICALASSVAVLIEGSKLGWQSTAIRIGIATATAGWLGFVSIEKRRRQPMLPLDLFRGPTFTASAFVSLVSALVFYGLLFLLSLYFQGERHLSPLQTGIAFLPLTVMVTAGSFASGPLSRRYSVSAVVAGGFVLYALGFAGLMALADDASYRRIAICFPAVGFGSGVITPAATAALMGAIDKAKAGVAAGILNASRQCGAAFGVALFGALMNNLHPPEVGIRAAVGLAIGLSLVGATAWACASALLPGTRAAS